MIRSLAVIAAAAPLLGGCVIYASEGGERDVTVQLASAVDKTDETGESLRAARFEDGRLVVRVDSDGCTSAANFEVRLVGDRPATLTLERVRPDPCRALVPEGVEVSWTYTELGLEAGDSVRLMNPIRLP
ncbi:hypothetical protein [Brevundimonas sp.]|uniref:hypothetical protein n=1 Tax=Brevundimonas sp. TaxID=1871086 RepID=UPI0022C71A99|nr:hypothetical protein [Brevundimonas sp.]MCZ8194224.1 hypothetical protein [Brevundimonas sp.]